MPPYLYVSTGAADHALVIVDACPTCAPAFVGAIQGPNITQPGRVSVYGNYAYVPASADNCLTIIDVSDPTNPTYVSSIGGPGFPNYLGGPYCCHVRPTPSGIFCYVGAAGDDSLVIIDVSDPTNPTLAGVARGAGAPDFLGNPWTVFVDDNLLAYLACATDNSLTIYDVSNPAAPVFAGNIASPGAPNFLGNVRDVVIRGIYAYTVSWNPALSIFNISNPAAPTFVGTVAHACLAGAYDLHIYGNYAYTAGQTSDALGIFDISNPAAPAFVSQLVDARFQTPRGIIVPEGAYPRAYILGSNVVVDSCCRLDVSNPAAPAYVTWFQGSGPPNYMETPQHITQNQTFLPIVRSNPATEIT